jgi:hypothetical protein
MKHGPPKFIVAAFLKEDVPGLLVQADGVVHGIETHPGLFPNAGPVVQGLKDARNALGDKQTTTGPLKRSAKARSPEERTLRNALVDASRFVETCANKDPENGAAIIAASTFSQKVWNTPPKPPLRLRRGPQAGSVITDAKAAKRGTNAYYFWRYSLDGVTWVEVAGTNVHTTQIDGLPSGKTVYVQVAISQRNIRSPWSDSASILVH